MPFPEEKTVNADVRQTLDALDARIKTLLPEAYRDSYEAVQPTPMGSAGLKYDVEGQVAWDQIWGGFCDLAMAGGPPHKGALLEPGTETDIDAQFDRYDAVVDAMAGWLLRAIVMENVAACRRGSILELPAAPHFRLEKEIKNVVTVIAKTSHYWLGHMPRDQQQAVGELFAAMAGEMPFVEPDLGYSGDDEPAALIASGIQRQTGLRRSPHRYAGWVGVECPSVSVAVWMMRALVASNIVSRREERVLFVPVNQMTDRGGAVVAAAVGRIYQCAGARGVLEREQR